MGVELRAMTCIVGLVDNGRIYMGGDSAGVSGLSLTIRRDEKVFQNGEFLIGFTSSFRMGQLLRYKLSPPTRHPDTDTYQYMATEFIDAVRQCLKEGGYAKKENEVEEAGMFLVGYQSELFFVDSDYQVGRGSNPYHAIGCGQDAALGVMYATEGRLPMERIKLALQAAERFSIGVRGPFTVLDMEILPDMTKRRTDLYYRLCGQHVPWWMAAFIADRWPVSRKP